MITLYKTETCPFCHQAQDFLNEQKIPHKAIDVSKDQKAAQEMIGKSGQMGVPVLDIDGEIVVGFDKEKILKLIKK